MLTLTINLLNGGKNVMEEIKSAEDIYEVLIERPDLTKFLSLYRQLPEDRQKVIYDIMTNYKGEEMLERLGELLHD